MFRIRKVQLVRPRDFYMFALKHYGLTGLQLFAWDGGRAMSSREWWKFVFFMLNTVFNLSAKVSFIFYGVFENTLFKMTLFIYASFAFTGFLKLFFIWLSRHTLRDVIFKMEAIFPMSPSIQRDYKLPAYHERIARNLRSISLFHWVVAASFMALPIVQSLLELKFGDDHKFTYRLPYIMYYPFDEKQPATYFVIYITQIFAGITVSAYFLGSELLLISSIYSLVIMFKMLLRVLKQFKATGTERDLVRLKAIFYFHSQLLHFAERINAVFNISNLLNYMYSVLVFCLLGFQLMVGTNFLQVIKFFGFMSSTALQLVFISHSATILIEVSQEIAQAFSEQEWHCTQIEYQRMLPLAIARAQRPAYMTAFKFFNISMESFSNLMTTSYQFFTLAKSRYDEM